MMIRYMKKEDKEHIIALVNKFYKTDAACHDVDIKIKERCFDEAIDGVDTFEGLVIEENDVIVGYAYVSKYYTTEIGGFTQMIEQLYVDDCTRGKGYGTKLLQWLEENNNDVKRMRLEVNNDNIHAIRLYQRLGYEFIDYGQMVKEKNSK